MSHFVSRDFARERLRLGLRQSYRLLPPCRGSTISTDEILALLNSSRRMIDKPILDIPTDIMTAEEICASPELEGSGITAKSLVGWTQHRTKNIPPHFRANKHTIRFSKSMFLSWLKGKAVA